MSNNSFNKISLRFLVVFTVLSFFSNNNFGSDINKGLVGHWEFNLKNCIDLSENGNFVQLSDSQIYQLGNKESCLRFVENSKPLLIQIKENSPLALKEGTFCFWMNVSGESSDILSFNNGAAELKIYRGDFQVRFKGEKELNYGAGILDYNWPKYDMREWAFYGHPKAAVHDSQWHHFAVAYDFQNHKIIGWRDGELIAVIDLSEVKVDELKQENLKHITIGEAFVGFLDDLRIYNRVLSDAEIRQIHQQKQSIFEIQFDTLPSNNSLQVYRYQKKDSTLYNAWLQNHSLKENF